MSFLQLHKLCSYLLALTGLLPLLLSGELHPVMWPVVLVGFGVSWRLEPPFTEGEVYRLRWTQVTVVGVLAAFVVGVTGIFPNPILLGAYLLILLLLNKLFNRNQSKDYLHLYILSFLMLTLGTIINTDISFAICFVLYVIFITWTLTLFHLRREIEETYLMQHTEDGGSAEQVDVKQILRSRRLVKGSFLFSTSLIALTIFAMSGVMFFMFPRIGFGLFFQRKRKGVSVSGFSNEMQLGSFRRIQVNHKVILRVEFPDQKNVKKRPVRLPHYWRGNGYDFYDGMTWKRSKRRLRSVRFASPDIFHIDPIPSRYRKRVIRQVIYQEPIDIPILFGIDHLYKVRLSRSFQDMARRVTPRVRKDVFHGTVQYTRRGGQEVSLRYEAWSVPGIPHVPRKFKVLLNRNFDKLYLQLPKNFNPRIRALAQRVTKDARTVQEKVRALETFLSTTYKYSLSRAPAKGPILDDFLFVQKLGHCEFFSTALVIMARSIGIHARQVTGFFGATWNSYGSYYAVRQSDAHAWAEVFLPKKGWVRFDASPRAPEGRMASMFRVLEEYVDSLRLRWLKWIIEYDLIHQIRALRTLRSQMSFSSDSSTQRSLGKKVGKAAKRSLPWGVSLLLLLALGGWFWVRRRGAGVVEVTFSEASRLYMQAEGLLAKAGNPRHEAETPREFATRIKGERPGLAVPLTLLTDVYIQLRYNPEAGKQYDISALIRALSQLEQATKEAPDVSKSGGDSA